MTSRPQRIEYQLAMREGRRPTRRRGWRLDVPAPLNTLALYRANGGWKVDHPATGRALSILDCVDEVGRGPKLGEAMNDVRAYVERPDFVAYLNKRWRELPILNPEFTPDN